MAPVIDLTPSNLLGQPPASSQHQYSPPSLPPRTIEKILRGEFIDFDDLLPSHRCPTSPSPPLELQVSGGDDNSALPVSLVYRNAGRRRITNFTSWLQAFTLYAQVLVSHAPARALELLAYQGVIAEAANTYQTQAWLLYDQRFRAKAAAQPDLRWDQVDNMLYLTSLTGLNRCRHCNSPAHGDSQCFRPRGVSAPTRSAGAPRIRSHVADSGRVICNNFNRGRCTNGTSCPREHICLRCAGSHSQQHCPSSGTNTTNGAQRATRSV